MNCDPSDDGHWQPMRWSSNRSPTANRSASTIGLPDLAVVIADINTIRITWGDGDSRDYIGAIDIGIVSRGAPEDRTNPAPVGAIVGSLVEQIGSKVQRIRRSGVLNERRINGRRIVRRTIGKATAASLRFATFWGRH
jgi:hypothetical protein